MTCLSLRCFGNNFSSGNTYEQVHSIYKTKYSNANVASELKLLVPSGFGTAGGMGGSTPTPTSRPAPPRAAGPALSSDHQPSSSSFSSAASARGSLDESDGRRIGRIVFGSEDEVGAGAGAAVRRAGEDDAGFSGSKGEAKDQGDFWMDDGSFGGAGGAVRATPSKSSASSASSATAGGVAGGTASATPFGGAGAGAGGARGAGGATPSADPAWLAGLHGALEEVSVLPLLSEAVDEAVFRRLGSPLLALIKLANRPRDAAFQRQMHRLRGASPCIHPNYVSCKVTH